VDTQTRHALKKDKFAQATATSVSWVSGHRSSVLRWAIAAVVVLALGIGGIVFWNLRTSAADTALGAALDVYNAPLATPGAPPESGTYSTTADRSPEGMKAHYFAGITYQELGQTGSAESELKAADGSWDHNLANLAKVALAGVYHQTARDPQATDLYNQIIAKPSVTVPASVAQLDLANLYVDDGKQDQARALWAKVKDADKTGAAGTIASQKLTGKQ